MKWIILTVIFSSYWRNAFAEGTDFVYSYAMAAHCKESIRRGYIYNEFYAVDAEDVKHVRSSANIAFEMHIAIQAASNGHILLSPMPNPIHNTSVYEIVVGGGGNKFTELRRNLKRNAKASANTPSILSSTELRGFYIKIYTSGIVEFGKEGATLPIIAFMDIDPLDITHFSFAAWNGVEAKFLYDCPAGNDSIANQTLPNSKAVEKKMSNSDRLKSELLQDRPPHMAPGPVVQVYLGVLIDDVTYNAFEAKLTTRMYLISSWRDENLSWYEGKFSNITSLTFRQGQIWRPTFQVFNSDSLDALQTSGHEVIRVAATGEAAFHFKAVVDTWCYSELEMNRWPRDKYVCSIVIQPWEPHEQITIIPMKKTDPIFKHFADIEDVYSNEWKLLSGNQTVISSYVWNLMYPTQNTLTHQSDRFVLQIEIQRQAASYDYVFYTPLLVLMSFVLVSFWSEPLQLSRIWFYAGATVVICMGLCFIDYLIPCHTVPSVLVLYITMLGGILFALILHVVMMTSVTEKICKTAIIQTMLSSKWFRTLFCLPVMKICKNYNTINEGFLTQEEDDIGVIVAPKVGTVEEMQEDHIKYCEKEELAGAVDKIMFVIYTVAFGVMLSLYS